MTDKTDSDTPEPEVVENPTPKKALLFELDNVAVKGRDLVYDVLSGILEEKDVDFSFGMFCQYCLYPPAKNYIPTILTKSGRTRLSEEKLAAEVSEAVKLMFVDGNIKLNSGMMDLIDRAIADGASIGAVSVFDEETTGRITEKLGLDEKGTVTLSNGSEDKHVPSTDAWLKISKSMRVPASCCVVIASSSKACKAALAAGMRCVVLPDKFTAFQDFGGADFVLESLESDGADGVIGLLDL